MKNRLKEKSALEHSTLYANGNNFDIKLDNSEYLSESDLSVLIAGSVLGILGQFPPIDSHIKNNILDLFGVLGCQRNPNSTYNITGKDRERILKNSKRVLRIGEQYFRRQPLGVKGYVSFETRGQNNLQQSIYIRERMSKINFENTLFHEIHHFIYNIIKFLHYQGNINLGAKYHLLHNEFFTRVNTANHSMLRHSSGGQNRNDTRGATGARQGKDRYAQSTRLAEYYIASRNMMYNIFLRKYGIDKSNSTNSNIQEPGYTLWSKIIQACNNYLFYINSKEGLESFLHIIRNASKQQSPKEILQYFHNARYSGTYIELIQNFLTELPKIT